jgi:hypothetical protein
VGKNSRERRYKDQARDRQHNRIVKIHGVSLMKSVGVVKSLRPPAAGNRVFSSANASGWSSCFSMFSAWNSLKAELQRVCPLNQKTLPVMAPSGFSVGRAFSQQKRCSPPERGRTE